MRRDVRSTVWLRVIDQQPQQALADRKGADTLPLHIADTAGLKFGAVSLQNNCVIVEALSGIDFIRVKDRLVYGILGII